MKLLYYIMIQMQKISSCQQDEPISLYFNEIFVDFSWEQEQFVDYKYKQSFHIHKSLTQKILPNITISSMKSLGYKLLPTNSKILNVFQDNNSKNISTSKPTKYKQHQKQKTKQLKTQPLHIQIEKDKRKVYKTKSQRLGAYLDNKNYQLKTCPDLQQPLLNKRTPKSANNKYSQSKSFTKTSKMTQANSKKNTFFCKINTHAQNQSTKMQLSGKVKKKKNKNQMNDIKKKSIKISKTQDIFQNHRNFIHKQTKSFFLFQQKILIKSIIDCQSSPISDRGNQSRTQLQSHPNKQTSFIQNYFNSIDMRVIKSMKHDLQKQVKKQQLKDIYNLQLSPIVYFTKIRRIPIKKLQISAIKIQRFWRRIQKKKITHDYNLIFNHILNGVDKIKQQNNQISPSKTSMLYIVSNSSQSDQEYQQVIKLIKVQQQQKSIIKQIQQDRFNESQNQLYKPYIDFGCQHPHTKTKPLPIIQKIFIQPPHREGNYENFNDYLNHQEQKIYSNQQQNIQINIDQPLGEFSHFYQSNNILPAENKNQLLDFCTYTQTEQNKDKYNTYNTLSLQDIQHIQKYYQNQCDQISKFLILELVNQVSSQLHYIQIKKSTSLNTQPDTALIPNQNDEQNMKENKKYQQKFEGNNLRNSISSEKNGKKQIYDQHKDGRLQRIQVNEISLNFYLQVLIQIILNNYPYILQVYDNMQYCINYSSYYFLKYIQSKLSISYSNSNSNSHFPSISSHQYNSSLQDPQEYLSYAYRLISIPEKIHKQCCQYIQLINSSQKTNLLDIWYQCIYQSFNQFLKQYRPYGLNTPNYPWSDSITIPHYFQLADLGGVLQLVRSKIGYLMGYQIGTLYDKKNLNKGMKEMNNFQQFELNEQKMVCYLSEWIGQDTKNWINYDRQKLVILLGMCEIIYNIVIEQIVLQIIQIGEDGAERV